jgi:hypothetical protein
MKQSVHHKHIVYTVYCIHNQIDSLPVHTVPYFNLTFPCMDTRTHICWNKTTCSLIIFHAPDRVVGCRREGSFLGRICIRSLGFCNQLWCTNVMIIAAYLTLSGFSGLGKWLRGPTGIDSDLVVFSGRGSIHHLVVTAIQSMSMVNDGDCERGGGVWKEKEVRRTGIYKGMNTSRTTPTVGAASLFMIPLGAFNPL